MPAPFTFSLEPDRYAQAVLHRAQRNVPSGPLRWLSLFTVGALHAALGMLLTLAYLQRTVPSRWVLGGSLAILVAVLVLGWLWRAGVANVVRRSTHMTASPLTLAVDDAGLRLAGANIDAFHPWSALLRIEEHHGLVYVMLDELHFYPIPASAFGPAASKDEWIAFARGRLAAAGGRLAPQAPAERAPSHEPIDFPGASPAAAQPPVLRMLGDAFRIALFRDVPEDRLALGWGTLLAVATLGALIPAIPLAWKVGATGHWNWFALPFAFFPVSLILAAAVAAAYARARREEVPRILAAGLLAAAAIELAIAALAIVAADYPRYREVAWRLGWLPGTWLALALATHAARRDAAPWRKLAVFVACGVLVALPLGNLYLDRSVWQAPYSPDASDTKEARYGAGGEDAFYRQPALLAQELQAVRPGRKGSVDVFFIGMAGYGMQDVFMREVDAVARLFRERFGAEGRTIRLVNNPKTLFDVPIASKTSLREALKRVAEVMDRDEDVLVLFMTSHGSEDHRFSLSLWPLRFHEVDPETLRKLLDESGIRHRVVIVSACYSGGFIKALADPATLVITASAPDRNSFGCSNEADWTYFGKAYFDEALRGTHSFAEAFERARPAIEAREKRENFDASQPQMAMGAEIASRLEILQAQLAGEPAPAASSATPIAARSAPRDSYEAYAALMFAPDYLAELRKACRQGMELGSPSEGLRVAPESYLGMERSRPHWNRLNAAWDAYAEGACAQANDAALVSGVYVEKLRQVMDPQEVEAALQLLSTAQARRWMDKDREATRLQQLELARRQADFANTLYRKFREEQDRIFEDYRKKAG